MAHNPIEVIQRHYAARARDWKPPTRGVFRASSAGHGTRRLILSYQSETTPPAPVSERSVRVFEHGDMRHYALRRALRAVWPDLPLGRLDHISGCLEDADEEVLLSADVWTDPSGCVWRLVGAPDGILSDVATADGHYNRAVLEIKTMSSFGFRRLRERREYQSSSRSWRELSLPEAIGTTYYAQIAAYCWLSGADGVVLIAEAKDTQALHQVTLTAPLPNTIGHTLARLQEVARHVHLETPGLAAPVCEGPDYGSEDSGKLRWGCSYCPYWRACYPTHVQWMRAGKLVTTPAPMVAADATVVGLGLSAEPSPGWNLRTTEGDDDE